MYFVHRLILDFQARCLTPSPSSTPFNCLMQHVLSFYLGERQAEEEEHSLRESHLGYIRRHTKGETHTT